MLNKVDVPIKVYITAELISPLQAYMFGVNIRNTTLQGMLLEINNQQNGRVNRGEVCQLQSRLFPNTCTKNFFRKF